MIIIMIIDVLMIVINGIRKLIKRRTNNNFHEKWSYILKTHSKWLSWRLISQNHALATFPLNIVECQTPFEALVLVRALWFVQFT